MSRFLMPFLLIFLGTSLVGCANFGKKLKAFLNKDEPQKVQSTARKIGPTFSQNPNLSQSPHRKYDRMTRRKFEDSSSIEPSAGSLWVMEGQGAYLFSQNIMRMIGDPIAVRIKGEPKEQLEAKTTVIGKLLKKMEAQRRAQMLARNPAAAKAQAQKPQPGAGTAGATKGGKAGEEKSESDFNVKRVQARIVERLVDGNYRIKGSQPFMIGQREYKTIVTGVVRAEDFSEEGIDAGKLIDPRFDIVSLRRREQ